MKVLLPCLQNLYTVSFSKPGFMELAGLSLAVDTEISLSFSTLEDTGTILLAVGGASPSSQKVPPPPSVFLAESLEYNILLESKQVFISWRFIASLGNNFYFPSFAFIFSRI